LLVLITTCLLLGMTAFAPASQAADISVIINGNQLATDVSPYIQDDRVLAPFRALFEALGATVSWDAENQVVTGTRGGKEVRLTIGNKTAYVDGKPVELDVPAAITGDRTFVPLRFVAESLGAEVGWDNASQTVRVSLGAVPVSPAAAVPRSVSVKDSFGHYTVVPSPPGRIVVLNSYVADAICAFGEEDRIVGAPKDVSSLPLLSQKLLAEDVGDTTAPNVGKIVALKPDIVFAPVTQKSEVTAQIQRNGIPVVLLDCSRLESLAGDLAVLGRILKQEERAGRLVDFINKNIALVTNRVKGLPGAKKPLVYWEGMSDYSTCSADSAEGRFLELAAGRNVAADARIPQPNVTPEWLLARDPEIIIKCPDVFSPVTKSPVSGYGQTDDAMKQIRQDIVSRPGWQKIDAVKSGKVYVLSRQIVAGPQAVVGLLYTAKWLHPDLFQDVDPSAVHASMLKEFYGLDYKGAWVCSGE